MIWQEFNAHCSLYLIVALKHKKSKHLEHVERLVQERRNSIANAPELQLSCTNPLMCSKVSKLKQGNIKMTIKQVHC